MLRRTRALVLATCLAGCGTFLGLSGDDEVDDENTSPPADVDGSADGRGGEGGNTVPGGGDSGIDSGTAKTDAAGGTDAAADVKIDGTNADGSSDGPALPTFRYVFVTGNAYAGSFRVGGGNADVICKGRAEDFGIAALKGRTWRAWISTMAENAATNIGGLGFLPYRLADGITMVADNFTDLTDGNLDHAIDRTEANVEITASPVWTGSNSAGALVSGVNCNDWTSVAQGMNGKVGTTVSATSAWSDSTDLGCTQAARLYCFEF